MRPRYVPQRGINLDYLMWLFTRISGLGIVVAGIDRAWLSDVYGSPPADGPAHRLALDILPQPKPCGQQQHPRCDPGMGKCFLADHAVPDRIPCLHPCSQRAAHDR